MNQAETAESQTSPEPRKRRWSRRVAADSVAILDVICVVAAAWITSITHTPIPGVSTASIEPILEASLMAAAILCILFRNIGYYNVWDLDSFPADPNRILTSLALSLLIVYTVGHAFSPAGPVLSPWFLTWFVISFVLLLAQRNLVHGLLKWLTEHGVFTRSVAIYGAGRIALKFSEHAREKRRGIHFEGIYDDRQDQERLQTFGLPVKGRLDDLIEAGRAGRIDKIIVALPQSADERLEYIVGRLEQLPVDIDICTHISSDLIGKQMSRHQLSSLGSLGLLEIKRRPLADWAPMIKRAFDIVVASVVLLVTAPLFALIALLIKSTSTGPVYFKQKRHGLNYREIMVTKFRTMTVMEEGDEVRQAEKDDPRVTWIGKFLRRTSLDELPNFINVLVGDMSVVGPRPHALVHTEQYEAELEKYANRHQVKPGITGWAQVNGYRGETKHTDLMRKRVEYDIDYINNWSLWRDVKILFMTPFYGVFNEAAY